MQCALADPSEAIRARRGRLASYSSSEYISFSSPIEFGWRCFLAPSLTSRYQVSVLDICLSGFGFMGRELPHLNWNVCGCCGNPSRDGISALGVRNVNDPVAQQEFLRFGENTVGDWNAVLLAAHNLGFPRSS